MDNDTTYMPATGDGVVPIASDDIDGVRHQRVKITWGVDGVATDASADTPLPVAPAPLGGVDADSVTVATPGTPVQLGDHPCQSVTVQADPDNTGRIYLGGATVDADKALALPPGAAHTADVDNTNRLWVDATAGGVVARYLWVA